MVCSLGICFPVHSYMCEFLVKVVTSIEVFSALFFFFFFEKFCFVLFFKFLFLFCLLSIFLGGEEETTVEKVYLFCVLPW